MNITIVRKGANPNPTDGDSLAPSILAAVEFVAPDRTPAPVPFTEGTLRLRRGVVYKLVTGLAIAGVTKSWQISARAQPAYWREGLLVVGIDVQPEVVFYVHAVGDVMLRLNEPAIIVDVVNHTFSLEKTSVTLATGTTLPPLGFSPAIVPNERVVKGMTQDVAPNGAKKAETPEETVARGNAWLDEDDGKGKVVGTDLTALTASVPSGASVTAFKE